MTHRYKFTFVGTAIAAKDFAGKCGRIQRVYKDGKRIA